MEKPIRVWSRERTGHSKHSVPKKKTRDDSTYAHHQMVNTKIRLIMFFADEDRETLDTSKNKTES